MIQPKKQTSRSGNIFIYILGAIFLMGILIVVVKGSYQPGTGIDAEKTVIAASQIRAYGSELERAVSLIMRSGMSENDIRFSHSADVAYGVLTPLSTYRAERQVFDIKGGGAEWKAPPAGSQAAATPWLFNARSYVDKVGTSCNGASCVELIAFLPDVTKTLCLLLNSSLGITNPSGNPPQERSGVQLDQPFVGTYTATPTNVDVTGDYLAGRMEGCFEGNSSGTNGLPGHYYYYKVLMAR